MDRKLLLCCVLIVQVFAFPRSQAKPHIVFVLADDLGWGDVGFHNSEIYTPNLDALASDGLILQNFYGGPQCTPSRASLMSGRYPSHVGLQHHVLSPGLDYGLPLNVTTLADAMRDAGYKTHAVGKWHLGFMSWSYTPVERGFDSFYGYLSGSEDYYSHRHGSGLDLYDNRQAVMDKNGTYSTHMYSDQAVNIISSHNASQPLFLYAAFQAVHTPLEVPSSYIERYKNIENKARRTYCGMVTCLDEAVGQIVAALKAANLWQDTLFVFSSDNGGPCEAGASNWPLRGGKHTLWEGGVHLTAFMHGQMLNKSRSGGSVYPGIMHMVDWLPTLMEASGYPSTHRQSSSFLPPIDGVSHWKSLTGNASEPRTEVLLNIDPVDNDSWYGGYAGIRVNNWKLLVGNPGTPNDWCKPASEDFESSKNLTCGHQGLPSNPHEGHLLFDLSADPNEHDDLSTDKPEIVKELLDRLNVYFASMVPPLNGTPEQRKTDPRANPKNFNGVWTPWVNSTRRVG